MKASLRYYITFCLANCGDQRVILLSWSAMKNLKDPSSSLLIISVAAGQSNWIVNIGYWMGLSTFWRDGLWIMDMVSMLLYDWIEQNQWLMPFILLCFHTKYNFDLHLDSLWLTLKLKLIGILSLHFRHLSLWNM